jgi:hypothetical protein
MHEVFATPDDILGMMARRARHIMMYVDAPTQDFSTEQLKRAIAALYQLSEELEKSLAKGKPANGQAEAN